GRPRPNHRPSNSGRLASAHWRPALAAQRRSIAGFERIWLRGFKALTFEHRSSQLSTRTQEAWHEEHDADDTPADLADPALRHGHACRPGGRHVDGGRP